MMTKLKEALFSTNGMRIVNGLFWLSVLFAGSRFARGGSFARSGLLIIAYFAWIVYLIFCIKNCSSKGSRIIYAAFVGVAAVLIAVNLYFLIMG